MISKSQVKFIQSLRQKKYRELHRCFTAEGSKLVQELMASRFVVTRIFSTPEWLNENRIPASIPVQEVHPFEMDRISSLSSPSPALAVVEIPQETATSPLSAGHDLTLVLDGIQDPGNLGTIIRIADWFGIGQVVCSPGCVDLYNPKVVQATMGSITRVKVRYTGLQSFFTSSGSPAPVYGMMLEGEDVFSVDIDPHGCLVIGSEANGISGEVVPFLTHRITIPSCPSGREHHAESLNAAVATGIVCAAARRDEGIDN